MLVSNVCCWTWCPIGKRARKRWTIMGKNIQKVAVLGAGTMGSRIAAHLANAGVQCLLLDMVSPGKEGRNRIAEMGLEGARKSKPAAFYEPELARLITTGNLDRK